MIIVKGYVIDKIFCKGYTTKKVENYFLDVIRTATPRQLDEGTNFCAS